MARPTQPVQETDQDEVQSQPEAQAQPGNEAQTPPSSLSSRMDVIALVVRLITLVCLLVSTILLATNSITISGYGTQTTTRFNDIYSYRYALATAVIGMAYTVMDLPFSIYQAMSPGKLLPNHAKLVVSEVLGDKVVLSLLGTGVGAIFGATLDLKTNLDALEDALELCINTAPLSKLDEFFNRAYFPAIFLLIGFITCGISSLLSSLALAANRPPQ